MIVQWCIKGLSLPTDDYARAIIDSGGGLVCNWWRRVSTISPQEIRTRLTENAIDMHVNHFDEKDPQTGLAISGDTPFISLSAGTVERDIVAKTNNVHRARRTALWFGTHFGRRDEAYLYTCWVLLAPRPAIGVEGVAEEVRDLNAYRKYSPYQTEGEIVAKIIVPDNHIQSCEKWEYDRAIPAIRKTWEYVNPRFSSPAVLSNIRALI